MKNKHKIIHPQFCLVKSTIKFKTASGLYVPETIRDTDMANITSQVFTLEDTYSGIEDVKGCITSSELVGSTTPTGELGARVVESKLKGFIGYELYINPGAGLFKLDSESTETERIEYCFVRETDIIAVMEPIPVLNA